MYQRREKNEGANMAFCFLFKTEEVKVNLKYKVIKRDGNPSKSEAPKEYSICKEEKVEHSPSYVN